MTPDAIRALREQVEAGEARPYEIEEAAMEIWREGVNGARRWEIINDTAKAYGDSLDAAKALHEALLCSDDPQYGYLVGPQYASIVHPSCGTVCDATSATPARAWLIAILRALEEEATG
jgi:hypothetical protein